MARATAPAMGLLRSDLTNRHGQAQARGKTRVDEAQTARYGDDMDTIARLCCIALGVVVLTGCSTPGRIIVDQADGSRIEVRQPGKATAPATVSRGNLNASTGNQQRQTPAMIAAGKSWISYIVGGILMLAGVGLLAAKKWLPILPTTAGIYAMLAGAGVVVTATISATVPWWVWAAAIGVGLVLVVPGVMDNKKRDQQRSAT